MTFRVSPKTAFWSSSILFAAIQGGIHLKNYFQVGEFFVVINDDHWDTAFQMISLPGRIISFLIAISFFGIHNYPYYLIVEILPLLFNCAIYGGIFYTFARLFDGIRRSAKLSP